MFSELNGAEKVGALEILLAIFAFRGFLRSLNGEPLTSTCVPVVESKNYREHNAAASIVFLGPPK